MMNNNYEPVRLEDNRLFLLDQRKLPNHMEYLEAATVEDVYDAIKDLAVRGAPAIGVAAGYGMYIAAPIVLKSDMPGVLYNGMIVVDKDGSLMGTYNKTHLWAGERFWFRAGCEYPVFDMEFGKVGFMICYDGGFPEISRILALKGAELILCPSAFPIRDKDMWDTYFGTRSLENGCFVGGLNRVGLESDDKTGEMFGDNKIYNPRGKLVAEAPLNEEALLVATLDLEDVGRYRENEVVYLRDRRPETYELLSKLY